MPPNIINRRAVDRLSLSVVLKTPEEVDSSRLKNRFTGSSSTMQASSDDYHLFTPSKRKITRQPGIASKVKQLQSQASCVLSGNGKDYHQRSNLPWKSINPNTNIPASEGTDSHIEDTSQHAFDFFGLDDAEAMGYTQTPSKPTTVSRHQRKKANQWKTWQSTIIPQLVQPLLQLRSVNKAEENISNIHCKCGMATSQMQILCIYWQRVAEQLMSNNLFPCAPYRPSLAVAIDVLDFICGLNTYQVPNNSAWCHALVAFHTKWNNKIDFSFDSLKRRFSNALFWYSVLDNAVAKYLDNFSAYAYQLQEQMNSEDSNSSPLGTSPRNSNSAAQVPYSPIPHSPPTNLLLSIITDDSNASVPSTVSGNITSNILHVNKTSINPLQALLPVGEESNLWHSATELLGKNLGIFSSEYEPSENKASLYLQNRCPCCFGGQLITDQPHHNHPHTNGSKTPSVIVQIDANFGQKRRHGKEDFPLSHPYTRFLSEDMVKAMESEVQVLRPDKGSQKKKRSNHTVVEDEMEATGLPTSVLDACESTFKAADDRREKASTQFFSDTGLMALLCRHDHVLFITNMKSAGEKQFYALALIDAIFKNLPDVDTISVGVLYDIGCQTHRSLNKWGLLAKYHHRLTFGVSIFHAYGHEWPCQLLYNPRKREGFGLSNGEGCERLWSHLKELIPNLRITGFHKRLYILDDHVQSDYHGSLETLSSWLYRVYTTAKNKMLDAQTILNTLNISEQSLRNGWQEQVIAQTKPLPSQSKNRTQILIQGTLRLRQEMNSLQDSIRDLEMERERYIIDPIKEQASHNLEETDIMLSDMWTRFKKVFSSYQNRLAALGVDEKRQLSKLLQNEYLTLRMNVRAKKQRIRERVRRRKMELGEITRRSVPSVNDRKLTDHSEKMITKREPTIIRLISEYNKGCAELTELIRKKSYPSGLKVVPPQPIDPKRVFTIDTDDSIWEDVGLEDDTNEIPQWLDDDDFREGIRAMLERDRAQEELQRLEIEIYHIQSWMTRVIDELTAALKQAQTIESEAVHAALKIRLTKFQKMFTIWCHYLKRMPGYDDVKIQERITQNSVINDLVSHEHSFQYEDEWENNSDGASSVTDPDAIEECGFLDTLEMIAINENEWENDAKGSRDDVATMDLTQSIGNIASGSSPNKRRRT